MGLMYLIGTCYIERNNATHITDKIVKTASLDKSDIKNNKKKNQQNSRIFEQAEKN